MRARPAASQIHSFACSPSLSSYACHKPSHPHAPPRGTAATRPLLWVRTGQATGTGQGLWANASGSRGSNADRIRQRGTGRIRLRGMHRAVDDAQYTNEAD